MSELARLVDVFASGQHTIYDRICERLTPVSLIRMRRVSRTTYQAVQDFDFSYRAFDVNRRLSRFFSDPFAFRSLQVRTATLISGSFALQFFDRTFYPEADLDLYVSKEYIGQMGQFMKDDGYTFEPTSWRSGDFDGNLGTGTFDPLMNHPP